MTHTSESTQSACSGGSAFACYSFAPTTVSSCLAYGFAAFNSGSCGDCYQLTFTGTSQNAGNDPGSAALKGKQMIVQVVNIGGIQQNQFDLMIPGGGVGAETQGCPQQWAGAALGATNGGFITQCETQSGNRSTQETCVQNMCSALPSGIQSGCDWQVSWFGIANNPNLVYEKVTCPSALTQASGLQ